MRKIFIIYIATFYIVLTFIGVASAQPATPFSLEVAKTYPKEVQLKLANEFYEEGISLFEKNELRNAELKFDQARQLFFENNYLEEGAEVLLQLATLYHQADFEEKAERVLKQTNAIWSALDKDEYQLKTIDLLAKFQLERKNFKAFNNYIQLLFRKATAFNDSLFVGRSYYYWGEWYRGAKQDSAIFFYNKAISYFSETETSDEAITYLKLADIIEDNSKAIEYKKRSLIYYKSKKDHFNIASCQIQLAKSLIVDKQYELAKGYLMKALSISNSFQYYENLIQVNLQLSDLHETTLDYKQGAVYYNSFIAYSDSFFFIQKQSQSRFLKDKYDIRERDKVLRQKEVELQIELEKTKNDRFSVLMTVAILVVVLLSIVFVLILSRKKKKNNDELEWQNAEILNQNEEILTQKEELERLIYYLKEQHEEILSQRTFLETQGEFANDQKKQIESLQSEIMLNIGFAAKLQANLLPSERKMHALLKDYFMVYYPQHYISGDFYWARKLDSERIIFAVADSTGHGMPGALMSVLGLSFLNEIVTEKPVKTAAGVLSELRKRIKLSLRTVSGETARDGYDIGICILSTETLELQYAGAYNPLYVVRNKVLEKLSANRFPAGLYLSFEKPFTNHIIQLQKNDMLYLFSDGITDQFGGENEKKYGTKRLKKLLIDTSEKEVKEQRIIVSDAFLDWKADLLQTDDVVILGIRI